MDCIFCKIVKGEIPSAKVYEDKNILAFLDITPVNFGHTLVIPKEHYKNIHDTPDDVLAKLFPVVKKIADAVKKGMAVEGINIGMNNGEAAGQVVSHFHIHVMPRSPNDGHKLWHGKNTRAMSK